MAEGQQACRPAVVTQGTGRMDCRLLLRGGRTSCLWRTAGAMTVPSSTACLMATAPAINRVARRITKGSGDTESKMAKGLSSTTQTTQKPSTGSGLPARWWERAKLTGSRGKCTTMKGPSWMASPTAKGRHTGQTHAQDGRANPQEIGPTDRRRLVMARQTICPWRMAAFTQARCSTTSHTAGAPAIVRIAENGTRESGEKDRGTARASAINPMARQRCMRANGKMGRWSVRGQYQRCPWRTAKSMMAKCSMGFHMAKALATRNPTPTAEDPSLKWTSMEAGKTGSGMGKAQSATATASQCSREDGRTGCRRRGLSFLILVATIRSGELANGCLLASPRCSMSVGRYPEWLVLKL
mmetsp:Transcript_6704/g.16275  ORF Transcript_6704/g.16275 Transcript_6704/m.16275 type:complete len:355 (-) Transcript_6704:95-1159(-)